MCGDRPEALKGTPVFVEPMLKYGLVYLSSNSAKGTPFAGSLTGVVAFKA